MPASEPGAAASSLESDPACSVFRGRDHGRIQRPRGFREETSDSRARKDLGRREVQEEWEQGSELGRIPRAILSFCLHCGFSQRCWSLTRRSSNVEHRGSSQVAYVRRQHC